MNKKKISTKHVFLVVRFVTTSFSVSFRHLVFLIFSASLQHHLFFYRHCLSPLVSYCSIHDWCMRTGKTKALPVYKILAQFVTISLSFIRTYFTYSSRELAYFAFYCFLVQLSLFLLSSFFLLPSLSLSLYFFSLLFHMFAFVVIYRHWNFFFLLVFS